MGNMNDSMREGNEERREDRDGKFSVHTLSLLSIFYIYTGIVAILIAVAPCPAYAGYLHVSDACGYENTTVTVPVELVDVDASTNCSIVGIEFELVFDEGVINLTGVHSGALTPQPGWDSPKVRSICAGGKRRHVIGVVGAASSAITNVSRGSILRLNFRVTGSPGDKTWMNISSIKLVNSSSFQYNSGTAPISPWNGTFSVCAPDTGCISGTVTYACNGSGVEGATVTLTGGGGYNKSTTTGAGGVYHFAAVPCGNHTSAYGYTVSAIKEGFLANSTSFYLASPSPATTVEPIPLWLKGDLNNDGVSRGVGDFVKMGLAWMGLIKKDFRYDLNSDGTPASIGDIFAMFTSRAT